MRTLWVCVVAGGLLAGGWVLTGCGKKEGGQAKPATNTAAGGNPITAPVDYIGAVGQAKVHSEKVVDTVSLKRTIELFYAQEDRYPKDLNELVTTKYLPSLPQLPAGMKFQYNPQNGEVKAVRTQ